MRTAAETLALHEADLVRYAGSQPEIEALILFGSGARNALRPGSDLDFAVVPVEGAEFDEVQQAVRIADILETDRFDLVRLDRAPPLLRHRGLQGEVLYCRDPRALTAFKVDAFKAYDDFRAGQAIRRKYRQERLLGRSAD